MNVTVRRDIFDWMVKLDALSSADREQNVAIENDSLTVILPSNVCANLLSGETVSLLLHRMGLKKDINSSFAFENRPRTNKQSASTRVFNWNNIVRDLKAHKITLDDETRQLIIAGDMDIIVDLINKMFVKAHTKSSPTAMETSRSVAGASNTQPLQERIIGAVDMSRFRIQHAAAKESRFGRWLCDSIKQHFGCLEGQAFLLVTRESDMFSLLHEFAHASLSAGNRTNVISWLTYLRDQVTQYISFCSSKCAPSAYNAQAQQAQLLGEMKHLCEIVRIGCVSPHDKIVQLSLQISRKVSHGLHSVNSDLQQSLADWMFSKQGILGALLELLEFKHERIKFYEQQLKRKGSGMIVGVKKNGQKDKKQIEEALSHGRVICDNIWQCLSKFAPWSSGLREVFTTYVPQVVEDAGLYVNTVFTFLKTLRPTENKTIFTRMKREKVIEWLIDRCQQIHSSPDANVDVQIQVIHLFGFVYQLFEIQDETRCERILDTLRNGCRSNTHNLQMASLTTSFELLSYFTAAQDRRTPQIYKTLIFSMIENHRDEIIRDFTMHRMADMLRKHENLPVSILVEPFVRQTVVNSCGKAHFDLFDAIVKHPRLALKQGMLVTHFMGKLCINDAVFSQKAMDVFIEFITRFSHEPAVQDYCSKFCKVAFSIFMQSAEEEHLPSLQHSPRLSRINSCRRRQSIVVLSKLTQVGIESVNFTMKQLLRSVMDDYMQLFGDMAPELSSLHHVLSGSTRFVLDGSNHDLMDSEKNISPTSSSENLPDITFPKLDVPQQTAGTTLSDDSDLISTTLNTHRSLKTEEIRVALDAAVQRLSQPEYSSDDDFGGQDSSSSDVYPDAPETVARAIEDIETVRKHREDRIVAEVRQKEEKQKKKKQLHDRMSKKFKKMKEERTVSREKLAAAVSSLSTTELPSARSHSSPTRSTRPTNKPTPDKSKRQTVSERGKAPSKKRKMFRDQPAVITPHIPPDIQQYMLELYGQPITKIFSKFKGKRPPPFKISSFDDLAKTKKCISLAEFGMIMEQYDMKKIVPKRRYSAIFREVGESGGRMCTKMQFIDGLWFLACALTQDDDVNPLEKVDALMKYFATTHEAKRLKPKNLWKSKRMSHITISHETNEQSAALVDEIEAELTAPVSDKAMSEHISVPESQPSVSSPKKRRKIKRKRKPKRTSQQTRRERGYEQYKTQLANQHDEERKRKEAKRIRRAKRLKDDLERKKRAKADAESERLRIRKEQMKHRKEQEEKLRREEMEERRKSKLLVAEYRAKKKLEKEAQEAARLERESEEREQNKKNLREWKLKQKEREQAKKQKEQVEKANGSPTKKRRTRKKPQSTSKQSTKTKSPKKQRSRPRSKQQKAQKLTVPKSPNLSKPKVKKSVKDETDVPIDDKSQTIESDDDDIFTPRRIPEDEPSPRQAPAPESVEVPDEPHNNEAIDAHVASGANENAPDVVVQQPSADVADAEKPVEMESHETTQPVDSASPPTEPQEDMPPTPREEPSQTPIEPNPDAEPKVADADVPGNEEPQHELEDGPKETEETEPQDVQEVPAQEVAQEPEPNPGTEENKEAAVEEAANEEPAESVAESDPQVAAVAEMVAQDEVPETTSEPAVRDEE